MTQPEIGSIPAHAGEPPSASTGPRPAWVYPRPRGGARYPDRFGCLDGGLSPPTRGSRSEAPSTLTVWGSIPAHAGEPTSS